jgi:hypothetical protein
LLAGLFADSGGKRWKFLTETPYLVNVIARLMLLSGFATIGPLRQSEKLSIVSARPVNGRLKAEAELPGY